MTTAAEAKAPYPDPRRFEMVAADKLVIDRRTQREVSPEKVARIANEFDWLKFECITAVRTKDGLVVVEGQHRTLAMQSLDGSVLVPCLVISRKADSREQAQIALGITQGRSVHTAYAQWMLRYNAGDEHEIMATVVMENRGVRLGQSPSAMTIGAVATVRRIVHGGNFDPEFGADLLERTLGIVMSAFPTHDHESNVSRWNRNILLAVANTILKAPELDSPRLARSLSVRPVAQWINLGRAQDQPPHTTIQAMMISEYNRNKRTGRIG